MAHNRVILLAFCVEGIVHFGSCELCGKPKELPVIFKCANWLNRLHRYKIVSEVATLTRLQSGQRPTDIRPTVGLRTASVLRIGQSFGK